MSSSHEELGQPGKTENETSISDSFMKAIDLSKVNIEHIGKMIINKDKDF